MYVKGSEKGHEIPLTSSPKPQDKGPHLYEFSPSGNCFEYYAMSIGARSQSAKTYLEAHFNEFEDCESPNGTLRPRPTR